MLGYGTLFARSSAGAVGDLEARSIPHIEKVYKIINALHNFTDAERKQITSLEDVTNPRDISNAAQGEKIETEEEATQKEKNVLLAIQGIKEVVLLEDADRREIFINEQDHNH